MKYLIYFIVILVNFVLAKDLFGHFTLAGAIPNLNLLLVIIAASESERLDFLYVAVVAGLITDIGFGLPVGTFSFAFLLSGLFAHLLFQGPWSLNLTWRNFGIITAAAVFLAYLWVILFSKLAFIIGMLPYAISFRYILDMIFFILIYNMVLAFPMFWLYTTITDYLKLKLSHSGAGFKI